MFDAFLAKEKQRNAKKEKFADKIEAGKEPNSKSISDGNQKKKPTQKSKKQEPKKRPLEEAIKDVSSRISILCFAYIRFKRFRYNRLEHDSDVGTCL